MDEIIIETNTTEATNTTTEVTAEVPIPKIDLREHIIKSACAALEEEGMRELSVRKIVAKAGCSTRTLYRYFKSLDEIILHINVSTLDMLCEFIDGLSLPRPNGLPVMAGHYFDFSVKHLARWKLLFEYEMPQGFVYPEWYGGKTTKLLDICEKHVKTFSGSHIAPSRRREVAMVIICGINGICNLCHSGKMLKYEDNDIKNLVGGFASTYVHGMNNGCTYYR